MKDLFCPFDVLLPKGGLESWSVVACDQYTSEPEYWRNAEKIAGGAPSTLRLILPEAYLGENDDARLVKIGENAQNYLKDGVFETLPNSYIYVRRQLLGGGVRRGLIGVIDLENYDYAVGTPAPIRATEGTVLSRIPPRVRVREASDLELSHVLLLMDDREDALLGYFDKRRAELPEVYRFELMQGAGLITGWRVDGKFKRRVDEVLSDIYFRDPVAPVLALGDGNHSVASAKASYEKLKETLGEAAKNHPRRWYLCELNNIHDESLRFEPIHRLVKGCDEIKLLKFLKERQCTGGHRVTAVSAAGDAALILDRALSPLPVGALQRLLDEYVSENPGELDYIHGEESLRKLASIDGSLGFLLPAPDKNGFFEALAADGVLPRKTFSMGEAADKRHYLEARAL